MLKKQKILVCGDVNGNFRSLFTRVSAVNEKSGPFDFLFCVGDFFGDSLDKLEPYRNGTLTVPVPTYILGPNQDKQVPFYGDLSGCEICPNVSYLGRHGILTSGGIKIAYVSGLDGGKTKTDVTFTEKDVNAVRDAAFRNKDGKQFLGVDVLLSSEWPLGVTKFDANAGDESEGSKTLAWLACQIKPRYHFCGLRDVFYERPPYKNCSSFEDGNYGNAHSTRFIGLAKVGNSGKKKWLYAANLTPLSELKGKDLYQSTTDETECPYSGLTAKNRETSNQFFYDMNAADDAAPKKRRKHSSSENEKRFDDPETCWFCLASSSVEKHLVISIGEEVYLALAKGGLTPFHAMIVPIKHHRCQSELSKAAADEVKKYKSCLRKFFKTKNSVPVFFERNFKTSHMQVHIVPVPERRSGDLKELFLAVSEERGLQMSELPNKAHLKDFAKPGTPYFYVELPTKEKLFCSCQKNFPINFGRDILASRSVLNIPERVNWRECVESKEKEEKMAQEFRKEFESFDEVS